MFVGVDPDVSAFQEKALEARPHPIFTNPSRPSMASFEPVMVPAGRYLVMGDNRDNSFDSRFFGFVERTRILGRATAVVLSVDWGHFRPRWGRFFTRLE
jgi:signal peptidase I